MSFKNLTSTGRNANEMPEPSPAKIPTINDPTKNDDPVDLTPDHAKAIPWPPAKFDQDNAGNRPPMKGLKGGRGG